MTSRDRCGQRKTYFNSVLKNLAPERQREIYEHLHRHSLLETRAWLAAAGLHLSVFPLHVFYHWYPMAAALQAASRVDQTVKEFLQEQPKLKPKERQLSLLAETVFLALGIEREDPRFILALWKLRKARARRE